MKEYCIALFVAPLMLGGAATTVPTSADIAAGQIRCEIRTIEIPHGLRLEPVVYGKPDETGRYQFQLSKQGSSGASTVSQKGEFTIEASGEALTGTTDLGLEPKDTYEAVMSGNAGGERFRCEQQ